METQGVIVGCDRHQEWLLPWWWHHYSRHNAYPVTFVDFGMSAQSIAWCSKRGGLLTMSSWNTIQEQEISPSHKIAWESQYGKGIWSRRSVWFKKPLALLQSPFSRGLWLDLDCQVKGILEPIFKTLSFGAEVGVVKEPVFMQDYERKQGRLLPGEVSYNSGVIVFRQNADIIHHWITELTEYNEIHAGDQAALSRAIFRHCPCPDSIELPPEYNWLRLMGPNPESLIHHFTGSPGKQEILKDMQSLSLLA